MNEEGSVLLKNENAALPLSKEETQKISLLGFSSYYPVQGGDFGSTLSENKGTDADTVDMLEAFESKGFEMNPTLKKMYQGLKEEFKSEAVLPWGVTTYYRATAPATTGVFTSLEPETATLDEAEPNWKKSMTDYNVMIVANTDTDSADPYVIDPDDKNLNYKFGTMSNETVIAQTFSKEMAAEYGAVTGNYSIWSNLPILWGAGTNLHRTPYNARNHEYYSEDAILTAYQAAAYIAAGKEYGCIIAPKHFAFNDTEINRSGIATFMTEQKARENELRGTQASVEDAQTLGMMTTFNRIGCTAGNAHYGLLMNILRKEWGFQGLMSEDFIQDANYSVLKEAVHCGVTMTCNTGDSNMEAVTAKWNYWTTESVSKDAVMMQDLKNVMMWQNYALANSNAMDGLNETSQIKDVRTWYDNALTATSAVLALLTLAAAAMYIRDAKRRKNS